MTILSSGGTGPTSTIKENFYMKTISFVLCFFQFIQRHKTPPQGNGSSSREDKKELAASEASQGNKLLSELFSFPQRCTNNIFRQWPEGINTFNEPGYRKNPLSSAELKVTSQTQHCSTQRTAVHLAPENRKATLSLPLSRGLDPCNNPIKAPSDNK